MHLKDGVKLLKDLFNIKLFSTFVWVAKVAVLPPEYKKVMETASSMPYSLRCPPARTLIGLSPP